MLKRTKTVLSSTFGWASFVVCLGGSASSLAGPPGGPKEDALREHFFPPDVVMRNQAVLALTDAQRAAILTEMKTAQAQFVELEWKIQAEVEKLSKLIAGPVLDEAQVILQAERVGDVDRMIRKNHLTLLIRIKNVLTKEQHAKLRSMRTMLPPPILPPPGPPTPSN